MQKFHSFALPKKKGFMNKRNITILAVIVVGLMARFLPLPPNFAAIGAIALFGGAYFSNRILALILPLAVLFASDLIFGLIDPQMAFYSSQPIVYLGFIFIGLLGFTLRGNKNPLKIAGASLGGSAVFFLVSNLGVWLTSAMYAKTIGGLIACYGAALPFLKYTVSGDLVFNTVFFGAAYFISQTSPKLLTASE